MQLWKGYSALLISLIVAVGRRTIMERETDPQKINSFPRYRILKRQSPVAVTFHDNLAYTDLDTTKYSIPSWTQYYELTQKSGGPTDYHACQEAAAAQVDSHTHLFPAAPCNPDNTTSRGGKVCRLLSCSYRGGETTLCRTVGSLVIAHHLPSSSPSLLS